MESDRLFDILQLWRSYAIIQLSGSARVFCVWNRVQKGVIAMRYGGGDGA